MIKQRAKLVTPAEDGIEELPTPVRATLAKTEKRESKERNLLVTAVLNEKEKLIYEMLSA